MIAPPAPDPPLSYEVIALGVFEPKPRYLVPVAGIVIGNAMTAAQAARPLLRRSLRSGLIPLVDQTKTTGLITFPGIMVGMLLGGADPVDAVRLQLIILYTLLGAVSLSSLIAMTLAYRNFFTAAHQLREAAVE